MIIHTIMLITTINHVWSSGRPGRQSTWSWVLDGWDPREKVEANHEDQFFHSWHLSDHDDHSNKLLDCWCSSSTLILPPKGGMRSIDRNAWASEAAFQAGTVLHRDELMFRVSFFIQKFHSLIKSWKWCSKKVLLQELEYLGGQLREESIRCDRLEEQMNDLTELHQVISTLGDVDDGGVFVQSILWWWYCCCCSFCRS